MAPGQLRIVPEAAGMGGLPTDLQPAVEADAAAGRRAGEDVEAGIGQGPSSPLLLLLAVVVVVVVLLLLLLDDESLLLLLAVVMVLLPLGETISRKGEDDGGARDKRDKGPDASHSG
ncbi:MAG TPA: hypothetical protein VH231_17275 [Solirubrobacteraceae bacterium]|nr:hypothetical protein [Solirubrobacteraceae bacterium]